MIGAILLGLVAGLVAKALIPGDVTERWSGPKGWVVAIAVGLAGALLGYLIFTVLLGIGDTDMFDLGGIIGAIIGAVIVLLVLTLVLRRARPGTT
jgi:uncharacterized membrane protein YeaQ/YmgE (transglycosylase-associated protein family)